MATHVESGAFASGSFALGSFESPLTLTAPGKHLARCYFVVSENQGRCDQLLCDISGDLVLFSSDEVETLGAGVAPVTEQYLGHDEKSQYWVAVFSGTLVNGSHQWLGLRSQLGRIDEASFSLAGRALQIAQWYFDHQYCGRCGNKTTADDLDRARVCPSCALRFYPRISPCMIVLVTHGTQLLLAHHLRSSKPVYTTLAGFIEAGERAEDTVRREVMEEVGVRLGRIDYFGSQAWPFPGQLMLGFIAEYESGDIRIDEREIRDADWFNYDQLPLVPPTATIAGQLINYYVQACIKQFDENTDNNIKTNDK